MHVLEGNTETLEYYKKTITRSMKRTMRCGTQHEVEHVQKRYSSETEFVTRTEYRHGSFEERPISSIIEVIRLDPVRIPIRIQTKRYLNSII